VKKPLALLDRFPPLFQRREIPFLTPSTDDPEPALCLVEGQTPSDGKCLDDLVMIEAVVAIETSGIHRSQKAE
jgi:hypothetical protein